MEAKKQLGQHFLINEGVALKIAKQCEGESLIIEIGPGKGALTEKLLVDNRTVIGVELDRELFGYLKEKFKGKNFYLIGGDAAHLKIKRKAVICGNLPYNSAKAIIKNFVLQFDFIPKMVFMVQKEVADTITAKPQTKEFSKFSVLCQLYYDTAKLFNVSAGSFKPKPKVVSSVVKFKRKKSSYQIDNSFFKFIDKLFSYPRKTVKNNLKPFSVREEFAHKRPSDLSLDEIYYLWREEWQNS
ncbi:16S rRNA (adenine(1518)-N(6)/adenine(1519)-N(6))-dimethyltransferase RsmA [Hippea alviniae]|uniref:16S rRNA (adenine(1518)-N(6)/adenine(1519)-N(6))- dimethyltransferase RsmA n=1 Tax=Hippea alviniae TaxID=1279027 RepID=UPI0003B3694B|nr:16S rRNA (adenine(1518)-N(6)/adenine(1519)-N(6))-dimethyltransferase RsmA [Hippea alviniae]